MSVNGDSTRSMTRRGFLGAAVGAGAAGGGAAAAGSDGSTGAGGNRAAAAQATQTVEMTDNLVFDPDSVTVAPGTTVRWTNVGNVQHSVTAYGNEIPSGAAYFASGGFDSEQAARDAYPEGAIGGGEEYTHTFEVEGTYEYFCIPHESAGMVGSIEVAAGGGGGEGPVESVLPDSARVAGILAGVALVLVVALSYFFLKYGGDYGGDRGSSE